MTTSEWRLRYSAGTSHGMSRNGPPKLWIHRLSNTLARWERHVGGKTVRAK